MIYLNKTEGIESFFVPLKQTTISYIRWDNWRFNLKSLTTPSGAVSDSRRNRNVWSAVRPGRLQQAWSEDQQAPGLEASPAGCRTESSRLLAAAEARRHGVADGSLALTACGHQKLNMELGTEVVTVRNLRDTLPPPFQSSPYGN